MIRTFIRTTAFAALAALSVAFSGGVATAATVSFSDGGGSGKGSLLPLGTFDIAVKMTSNNNKLPGLDSVWGGMSGAQVLTVTGKFFYSSKDKRDASFDPLGFFVGAAYTSLLDLTLPVKALQKGTFSFVVPVNTVFGWVLHSTDGKKGQATAAIRANVEATAVPLPAGGFLLLGAMGGLAALRRRKAA